MKKLLYLTALSVMFVSCSVDSIHEENQIGINDLNKKNDPVDDGSSLCGFADVVDANGKVIGVVEALYNAQKQIVAVSITTYNWKIKTSKIYVGPTLNSAENNPQLYETGKFFYKESFKDGVYNAVYEFEELSIKKDYCIMTSLTITDDVTTGVAFSQGKPLPGSENGLYLMDFFKSCL